MQFSKFMRLLMNRNIVSRNVSSSVSSNNHLPSVSEIPNNELNALQNVSKDLSLIAPYFPESFNLAAYVNKSENLQNLMHLNVDLSKIEKKPHIAQKILKLDFEQDIKKHILFIKEYVESEDIGNYITRNPMILCEPLEDLQVRVNYLTSKRFSDSQIRRIIGRNPFWLMFSTPRIDRRLGYYQDRFQLSGDEVRFLSARQPQIITYSFHHIKTNTFVINEEMGFEENEMKHLILSKPKLWMLNQRTLLERFNYIHNVIGISHDTLLTYPEVLLCRNFKVKQRHLFLQKLGRAQYDPTKASYVPIKALVENTDNDFCREYAKCHVSDFNIFLKTL